MKLTASDLAAVASMMAKRGVNVICAGNECFTDGRTIVLPVMPEHISEPLFRLVRFFLDHEAGHIIGESDPECTVEIEKSCGKAGQAILNALEDVRTDSIMAKEWAGCKVNLRLGLDELMEHLELGLQKDDELMQLVRGIYITGKGMELPEWIGEKMAKVIGDFRESITSIPGSVKDGSLAKTSQLVDLAENIYAAANLELKPPEEGEQEGEQQQSQQPQEGESEGDGGAGTEQQQDSPEKQDPSAGDGEKTGESEPGDGEGEANDSKGDAGDREDGADDREETKSGGDGAGGDGAGGDDGQEPQHDPDQDPLNQGPAPSQIGEFAADATNDSLEDAMKDPANRFSAARPLTPGAEKEEVYNGQDNPDDTTRFYDRAMAAAGPIRQRLSMMLQSEDKKWWRGGQTRGWPDPRSMAMLAAGLSNEVMRRRFKKEAPNTACYLLVDGSSSMNAGDRLVNAMLAALAFSATLDVCGHANKVGMFSSRSETLQSGLWKQFSATRAGDGQITYREVTTDKNGHESDLLNKLHGMGGSGREGVLIRVIKRWQEVARMVLPKFSSASKAATGSTPMAEAIQMAAKDLMSRREERKVLMVFTDGEPNHRPRAIEIIKECERAGIEVVLIGIGYKKVEELHHKTAIVYDIADLASTTIKELASVLRVGHSYQPQRRR